MFILTLYYWHIIISWFYIVFWLFCISNFTGYIIIFNRHISTEGNILQWLFTWLNKHCFTTTFFLKICDYIMSFFNGWSTYNEILELCSLLKWTQFNAARGHTCHSLLPKKNRFIRIGKHLEYRLFFFLHYFQTLTFNGISLTLVESQKCTMFYELLYWYFTFIDIKIFIS